MATALVTLALVGCTATVASEPPVTVVVGEGVAPPTAYSVPPGHLPPPGSCRVWYPDRPPGQQPPPGPCHVYVPHGAILLKG